MAIKKIYPYFYLVSTFALLFIYIPLDFGIEGDDIYMIDPTLSGRALAEWANASYTSIASQRHFLELSLIALYRICGFSTVLMEKIFISIWVLNGVLFYTLLRKFYKVGPTLLATLLFLMYSGKFEVMAVPSGGMYHVVIGLFLVILLLTFSKILSWPIKMLCVSILLWLSFHLYELLLPIVFLYPIYYWYQEKSTQKNNAYISAIFSFLPLLLALNHLRILASSSAPIWERSGPRSIIELGSSISKIFIINLDALFGLRHWIHLLDSWNGLLHLNKLGGFTQFIWGTIPLVIGVTLGLFICLRLSLAKNKSQEKKNQPNRKNQIAFFVLACYLLLLAHLTSLPVVIDGGFTPSRFTYLPLVGACILLAQLMNIDGWKGRFFIILVFFLIILEGVATRIILFQYSTIAKYDTNIRLEIKKFNLHPKIGDTIYISLPENGLIHHVWKLAPAKFESGQAQSLLLLDFPQFFAEGPLPLGDRLFYRKHVRSQHSSEDIDFLSFLKADSPSPDNLYAFILLSNNQLCGVKNLILVNDQDKVIIKKEISNFPKNSNGCLIDMKFPLEVLKK